jgi:integrase
MGRRREETKPTRFLSLRGGIYQYVRSVPKEVFDLDNRAPYVRVSLRTSDLGKAMAIRDVRERADNDYWASLIVGDDSDLALRRYKAATSRAVALGFTYRSAADILHDPIESRLSRIEQAKANIKDQLSIDAVLGLAEDADQTISAAIDLYINTIARADIRNKSKEQRRIWENVKRAPIATFKDVVSDKQMSEITREDAQKVYNFWLNRVAPEKGKPTHSASIANKHMDGLRVLYREWFKHQGQSEIKNPFDGLRFRESKSQKKKQKRPPFSTEWIQTKFLQKGKLANLNREARGVFLAMIETGCRLSEIANLTAENIVLNSDVPHIRIEPSFDSDEPREIKTDSSIRLIPLVGVSLAVLQKYKKGFPRYRDKGSALSATMNKFLRENELLETPKHKAYSLRHSFEDRMKNGGLDSELRMMLMGHSIDRPDYGSGGSLEWKCRELSKIALPFDPKIV